MSENRPYYRIRKWDEFQHYKDRNPPWIKLHRDLLTSETWVSSSSQDRELAIAIMMLAAATENKIPADSRYIRRVAYLDYDPDLSHLISMGFVELVDNVQQNEGASTVLADARPETEERQSRAEERREEAEEKSSLRSGEDDPPKPSVRKSRRKPETSLPDDFPTAELKTEAAHFWRSEGFGFNVDMEAAQFRDYCRQHDKRYRDWPAAWRTRYRNAVKFAKERDTQRSPPDARSSGNVLKWAR